LAGVLLAAILLGEPIRPTFVFGGVLVLVGVWVGAFSARSVPSSASVQTGAEPNVDRAALVAADDIGGRAERGLSPRT
jgi:hypothetical protein